ncbi:MAG TPA: ABC transporter ATP-binding protein [Roseiflexaceae bacterium]|nr:ABC transporter ATP-binding protein [Roseiflexaceae bacterium]
MADLPILDIRDVVKDYGDTPALRGVSLGVAPGAIVCLLGPSGCGKTTLLRVIAGLERADAGVVVFAGRPIDGVPVHERGFGLMFQDYALFPHRDVAGNVAFGLRMHGWPREQIEARVAEMLDLVGLAGYDRRRVYELSGGERQRVALARSLAPSPRLLMLDEPLGALDRALRERLLEELRAILKRVGVTSIYVTHDQTEAFAIADWLVLMNDGLIEQQGPPEAVYRRPATRFAARFLGLSNLIDGRVLEREDNALLFETPLGRMRAVGSVLDTRPGDSVTLVIRPEAAAPIQAVTDGANTIAGVVAERSFRGSRTRLAIQHPSGQTLEFELDDTALPPIGDPITLALRADAISLITG